MKEPMLCPQVSEFAFNWDAAIAALADAPALTYGQHWLPTLQPEFRGGSIKLGWRGNRFYAFGDLADELPTTRATKRNEHLYLLGDVLELFAGVTGESTYIEYHYSPNGLTFQLLWPQLLSEAMAAGAGKKVDDFVICDDDTRYLVRIIPGGWQVLIDLPAAAIGSSADTLSGLTWDVSFGRYDSLSENGPSILSNTSALTKPSYHRRDEWRQVRFV